MQVGIDQKLVLSPTEAAALLGEGPNEIRAKLVAGIIRGWRTGDTGHWRIPRQSLDEYIARQLDGAS